MSRNTSFTRTLTATACAVILAAGACIGAAASAAGDSCREWLKEHCEWKAEVMRSYLHGEPQSAVDNAMFEMLQREAYLTSCDSSTQAARDALVGWRLVDRNPDDYAGAVLEAVLERSGFALDLRDRLGPVLESAPIGDPVGTARRADERRTNAARVARRGRTIAPH